MVENDCSISDLCGNKMYDSIKVSEWQLQMDTSSFSAEGNGHISCKSSQAHTKSGKALWRMTRICPVFIIHSFVSQILWAGLTRGTVLFGKQSWAAPFGERARATGKCLTPVTSKQFVSWSLSWMFMRWFFKIPPKKSCNYWALKILMLSHYLFWCSS